MRPDEWWKNFSLGLELDLAGAFIYNGLRSLHGLENLDHSVDVFEILYNLSVGQERLLKVAIILGEHDGSVDPKEFEESLKTHSTIDLADRLGRLTDLNLSPIHRRFLGILSEFYHIHRYGRYSPAIVPHIDLEKRAFLSFLSDHVDVSLDHGDGLLPVRNSNQVRRFVGKVVKRISRPVFEYIWDRAHDLNIYTYELRGDSKAVKVFWGERLDFVDEDQAKREILLFLISPSSKGEHLDLLRSFDCLDLDPALAPDHVRALLNDIHLPFVQGEVEELYTEVEDVGARFDMLAVMDETLFFGAEDE